MLLAAQIFAPALAERVVGETYLAVKGAVTDTVQSISPEATPTVSLGPLGGEREMDECDGAFIELASYRISGVLPVYAAHNVCGGDIILNWEMGELVRVSGSEQTWKVVDERHTPKWGNVGSLRGMEGQLLLQTCFYGQDKMRFLALEPMPEPEVSPTPRTQHDQPPRMKVTSTPTN